MILKKMELPVQNKVLHAYKNNAAFLHKYFDYPNEDDAYQERVEELALREFKREELTDAIHAFMAPFGISSTAKEHLEELKRNDAVTVVGGQQAGILTGPLYSIHKAITVLLHAKEQRRKLGVPVIPVFWVAGEDHDINEINHVYSEVNGQVTKEQIQDKFVWKLMSSDARFDRGAMVTFVKGIFGKFGETAFTEALLESVLEAVRQENTFTGFFVRLMNGLFREEGLLFIDAAFPKLRELESDYFCQLIEASDQIASLVVEKERTLQLDGFGLPIDARKDASHLFYVHETGRMLLTRQDELFVNESVGLSFTEDELLQIAKEQPSLLSNNVVTRPIMQDFVFPVLSFVGGAGELAYWAILREAFHHLSLKMPIFVPRMSITFVSRQTEKTLQEQTLSVEDVMAGKASEQKYAFIERVQDDWFTREIDMLQKSVSDEYKRLMEWFEVDDVMMNKLLKQNLSYHNKQFTYLKYKYEDTIYVKHEVMLQKFNQLEAELYPNRQLQERVHHPYAYLNEYGPTLIHDLLALPFDNDGAHYLVYL